jgi:hypothetical protein
VRGQLGEGRISARVDLPLAVHQRPDRKLVEDDLDHRRMRLNPDRRRFCLALRKYQLGDVAEEQKHRQHDGWRGDQHVGDPAQKAGARIAGGHEPAGQQRQHDQCATRAVGHPLEDLQGNRRHQQGDEGQVEPPAQPAVDLRHDGFEGEHRQRGHEGEGEREDEDVCGAVAAGDEKIGITSEQVE